VIISTETRQPANRFGCFSPFNLQAEAWMKKNVRRNLTQAAACLICAIPAWRYSGFLEGTEFSGGRTTGPLLSIEEAASYLLLLGLVLTFLYRRIAAAVTIVASVLCLPIYLCFVAPGPFRWVFPGRYMGSLAADYVWAAWAAAGIVSVAIALYVCLAALLVRSDRNGASSVNRGNRAVL